MDLEPIPDDPAPESKALTRRSLWPLPSVVFYGGFSIYLLIDQLGKLF